MRHFATILLAIVSAMPLMARAQYDPRPGLTLSGEPDEAVWTEDKIELPNFPKQENLVEFYVSPVATNKYMIDRASISVGKDEIVRYTLVVMSSGGARNVSYEGIRCDELRWKLYATGHGDGTWAKARLSEWRPIENKPVNRHHAALSRDFFCPGGSGIRNADEGANALRLGKHPNAN